jgi:hypothetical protein
MKCIAWRNGQPTDARRDYEPTDWAALAAFVNRFLDAPPAHREGARLSR